MSVYEVIAAARKAHSCEVTHWRLGFYGWRCSCGAGISDEKLLTDRETAAAAVGTHQDAAIVDALLDAGFCLEEHVVSKEPAWLEEHDGILRPTCAVGEPTHMRMVTRWPDGRVDHSDYVSLADAD